jgi:AcrR family transcriptional regulator
MAGADGTTVNEPRRTPRGEARARAQRERILAAAQKCFVAHGFHAASMAQISETAQMSAGLIYRYFSSKNAIILAIIERQLQEAQHSIAALTSSSDLVTLMTELLENRHSSVVDVFNPVLYLEMSALADREPEVAAALANTDRMLRADMRRWLRQFTRTQGLTLAPKEIELRQLALQCFFEGLVVRSVRNPDLDPRVLAAGLEEFLRRLLPPPDLPEGGR